MTGRRSCCSSMEATQARYQNWHGTLARNGSLLASAMYGTKLRNKLGHTESEHYLLSFATVCTINTNYLFV
jgi:hypothetical protein